MSEAEEKLIEAALYGRVAEVSSLLRDNPGLNVNWGDYTNGLPFSMLPMMAMLKL